MMKMIVTGGGTGGHLFPGIAVAEAVQNAFAGSQIMFIGTRRRVDNKVLAGRDFAVEHIDCSGLKGKSVKQIAKALIQLPLSLWQAMGLIKRFRPEMVVGVGGYVTGPVILAAKIKGVPTAIHEQNSVPGLANRLLGKIADRVFLSIPGSEHYFPAAKCLLSGNPVRQEILAIAQTEDTRREKKTLLVLGGSLGAHAINMMVPKALRGNRDNLPDGLRVIHQTGVQDVDEVKKAYKEAGINADVSAFIDDMAQVYRQADLIVSRAGATTLAEITVMQKPAILIPYPFAADNHQDKNAAYLADNGAAIVHRQDKMSAKDIGADIERIFSDADLAKGMADKAAELARPHATKTIMEECLRLIGTKFSSDK